MNNNQHQILVQEATERKFKDKDTIVSRSVPKYPVTAEREFKRVLNGYVKLLNGVVKDRLVKIMKEYKDEMDGNYRSDDTRELSEKVRAEMQAAAEELEQAIAKFGIGKLIAKVANMTVRVSKREWKRIVRDSLGIDISEDYYNGKFYEQALKKWIDENVGLIKSVPSQTLGDMREIILNGFSHGRSIRSITKEIQNVYGLAKSKARLIARDQLSTLYADITEQQQRDAGCDEYKWSSSKDSRVRECHRELDGQILKWDDPPRMWYMTKGGKVYTDRRCHPGEDYQCRCVAIPVFKRDKVNVPFQENKR